MDGGSSSESSDSSVGFVSDSSSSLHTSAVITDLSALSGASESSETSAVGSSRGASPSTLAPSFLDCADGSLDADVGVLAVAGDDCPDLSTSGTCSSGLLAVDLDNADAGNGAADDRAAGAGQAMEGVDASDDTAFAGMTDGGGDACLCPDGGSDAPASPAGCGFAAAGNDGAQTPVCGTELPAKRRLVYKHVAYIRLGGAQGPSTAKWTARAAAPRAATPAEGVVATPLPDPCKRVGRRTGPERSRHGWG